MTQKELKYKAILLVNTLKENNELLKRIASYVCEKEVKEAILLSYDIDTKNKEYIIIKLLIDNIESTIKFEF